MVLVTYSNWKARDVYLSYRVRVIQKIQGNLQLCPKFSHQSKCYANSIQHEAYSPNFGIAKMEYPAKGVFSIDRIDK